MRTNQYLIERLQRYTCSLIESNDEFINFLKKYKDKEIICDIILDEFRDNPNKTPKVYYGDFMYSSIPYFIIKNSFENKNFDSSYIKRIETDILKAWKIIKPGPAIELEFNAEERKNGIAKKFLKEVARKLNCKPEDIMTIKIGSDDTYSDFMSIRELIIDLEEILEKINTPVSKKYLQAIRTNTTCKKAKEMSILPLWGNEVEKIQLYRKSHPLNSEEEEYQKFYRDRPDLKSISKLSQKQLLNNLDKLLK